MPAHRLRGQGGDRLVLCHDPYGRHGLRHVFLPPGGRPGGAGLSGPGRPPAPGAGRLLEHRGHPALPGEGRRVLRVQHPHAEEDGAAAVRRGGEAGGHPGNALRDHAAAGRREREKDDPAPGQGRGQQPGNGFGGRGDHPEGRQQDHAGCGRQPDRH